MIKGLDYWYDAQMRRFLEQVVRGFSGFKYSTGRRDGEEPQLIMVPCKLASMDRVVSSIMRNLSENTLLTVPMITVAMVNLTPRRADLQHPAHVDSRKVFERDIDEETGKYLPGRGRSYTVHRMMPRPFMMEIQVDIWTSNMEQKHQLAEQVLTIFFPDISIQNSDNALDWSAMTTMSLESINWSSRSIPVGTENEIDVMTINFNLPFWLNPPAEVIQQKVIEQVVTNMKDGYIDDDGFAVEKLNIFQDITTPGNHNVEVKNGKIILLDEIGTEVDPKTGEIHKWIDLFNLYGKYRPAVSRIRIKTHEDIENDVGDIVGTIQIDENKPNELFWQIDPDTLPANTISPVDAIIDPLRTFPGEGLPMPSPKQRYLILNDIGPSQAWGTIHAKTNDIIEFFNGSWNITYSASSHPNGNDFVLNLHTGRQLRWTGTDWVLTVGGKYSPGYWRLSL